MVFINRQLLRFWEPSNALSAQNQLDLRPSRIGDLLGGLVSAIEVQSQVQKMGGTGPLWSGAWFKVLVYFANLFGLVRMLPFLSDICAIEDEMARWSPN